MTGSTDSLTGTPFLDRHEIDEDMRDLLSLEFCLENEIALLGRRPRAPGGTALLGMTDPYDERLRTIVEERTGLRLSPEPLSRFELRHALSRIYDIHLGSTEGSIIRLLETAPASFDAIETASDLVDRLLETAVAARASDALIECYDRDVDFRLRIDGVLHQIRTPLSPQNAHRVVARIKVLGGLESTEHHDSQDGHFSAVYGTEDRQRRVDFRVSVIPGPYGEDVALRLFDSSRVLLDLDLVFLDSDLLSRYRSLIERPHGLLLLVGPTGAGKTTTLYATLHTLSRADTKIVSVEDPIEYELPGVNQKSISRSMGFSTYLRAILRQSPDTILVGEIRDPETAEIAVRAATTGHLVLSTVHASDALSAVGRLRSLGVEDDLTSDVLIASVGQRLLRRICPDCSTEAQPSERLLSLFYPGGVASNVPFFEGVGCSRCGDSGYRGLLAAFEILEPTSDLIAAIAQGSPVEQLRRIAKESGHLPIVHDALDKVTRGLTSLSEVSRRISPPSSA